MWYLKEKRKKRAVLSFKFKKLSSFKKKNLGFEEHSNVFFYIIHILENFYRLVEFIIIAEY